MNNPFNLEKLLRSRIISEKFLKFCDSLGIMKFIDYPAALSLSGSNLAPNVGAVLASAATVTITSAVHKVSGTTQITLVKIPVGFRGMFAFIPTGAYTEATGGTYAGSDGTNESIPCALASTAVASKLHIHVTDGLLVYPSY